MKMPRKIFIASHYFPFPVFSEIEELLTFWTTPLRNIWTPVRNLPKTVCPTESKDILYKSYV